MKNLLSLILLIIIINAVGTSQSADALKQEFFNHDGLKHAGIGITVVDQNGHIIIDHNSSLNLIPASTLKIITSIEALEYLSPDFTFTTSISHTGSLGKDGILSGDLIISTSGDPSLCSTFIVGPSMDQLCNSIFTYLNDQNISCIEGRIRFDSPLQLREPIEETWLWQDIANYYAGGAYSFNILDNSYSLYFDTRGSIGSTPPLSTIYPIIPNQTYTNLLTIAGSNTGDQSYIFGGPDQLNKSIKGTLPQQSTPYKIKGAIHKPDQFFSTYLMDYLTKRNILINEGSIDFNKEKQSSSEVLHISPTLIELLKIVNKKSVNLYAEAILNTTLTNLNLHSPQKATQHLINKWGLDHNGYVIRDGSGLSSRNAIYSGMMTDLLHHAQHQPWFNHFTSSLAQSGEAGTLSRLFISKDKRIHVKAKSGSMSKVRAYAGYIYREEQLLYTFTIMVNNYDLSDASLKKRIEKLVLGVADLPLK